MKFKSSIILYLLLILSSLNVIKAAHAYSPPNVWDVLRKQFLLSHEITRPEVQSQIRWLIAHPSYLHKLTQSEPYIYHILTEVKKRKMPGEIALIPMIESAYDPFAYSGAGAAGLWQLMPGTGTGLGLKQDWWYDGRRSIGPSTDAALNYLGYLNKFFNGNWLLAFAAYDSGEGTIARLIKNNGQNRNINFWSLPVPQETKIYVPRLLALAAIIQNPQRYHIQLPEIPHMPYFEEVNIGSQIDLSHAAKLAGISYKELIKLNPGYNRWTTAPYRPYKLLIPVDRVEDFSRNLANFPEEKRVSWTRHQVSAGDNLTLIAQKYHTTANLIKELNQLKTNSVKKGQFVLVPSNKNTPALSSAGKSPPPMNKSSHFNEIHYYKVVHIIQKNDSYAQLVRKYGVTESNIRKWNRLGPRTPLSLGKQLIIWKYNNRGSYTIKQGDNLSSIAKRFHTNVKSIMQLNPELHKHVLKPGQKIILG
ncbi:lytic transglycosylase [Legionella oakridgensis]|uniref:Soluble lytic murein transglycosylase-related regulatory protein n=2 Tax=Legionella oakridgensis TaxID=29423 RepID=W0BGE5_9GAMM|nr:LysM peptidoglycan-binding domain-containing protein [Legionella oakridgensis]AHE67509.1 soluble lytic murein transglycosylase-related regulatory protein [Legionella oakridgensis ATCC 33761 = DSM 21215]ETO92895.1 soluble lytic murein transglycosylase [Legionella oakridgensis RV-2-2007]KTD37131.1 membrane bound lytic murein transglycosylase D [Legionella oakridgensis]STY20556.1 membrane bound lytic murein transglycosylase D [Legionella longbeachae]